MSEADVKFFINQCTNMLSLAYKISGRHEDVPSTARGVLADLEAMQDNTKSPKEFLAATARKVLEIIEGETR